MRRGDDLRQYLRLERMPDMWCPGCGHGNTMTALATVFKRLECDLDDYVLVGGIGCAPRMTFYLDVNAMHTTHGRALAFATGIKLARPELNVLAVMGDGDALAIGGNHLIHACRRNIDITALVLNNQIYGMTGGQAAATTPTGFRTTTSSKGTIEPAFDTVELAIAAGATFVARTTTFDFDDLPRVIEAGMRHRGFSLIEVISQCPTYFARLNRLGKGRDLLEYERDITEPGVQVSRDELVQNLPIGVFRDDDRGELTRRYAQLCARMADNGHAR